MAVADSRLTFSDAETGKDLAYADGLNKILRFDSAILAETGQGFLGEERFDLFLSRFERSAGELPPESILPALLDYGARTLDAGDLQALARQHMAVAKFYSGKPVICGFDGRMRPCVSRDYIQSSPTDFEKTAPKLSQMTALETATEARASMERYIAANKRQSTMGGQFAAVLLTPTGARNLWMLDDPIAARNLDELINLVLTRKLKVTLLPPATWEDLKKLLE